MNNSTKQQEYNIKLRLDLRIFKKKTVTSETFYSIFRQVQLLI